MAEYQVRHRCQRQSALKKKNFFPRALSSMLNTVYWRTPACKMHAQPKCEKGMLCSASTQHPLVRVRKTKLLLCASIQVFREACRTTWNRVKRERLCIIDDTFEISPGRRIYKYEVAYSCSHGSKWGNGNLLALLFRATLLTTLWYYKFVVFTDILAGFLSTTETVFFQLCCWIL